MRPKAIDVQVLNNYELQITFDNYEKRKFLKFLKFDVKPYFKFKKFQELKDKEKLKKVKIAGLSI